MNVRTCAAVLAMIVGPALIVSPVSASSHDMSRKSCKVVVKKVHGKKKKVSVCTKPRQTPVRAIFHGPADVAVTSSGDVLVADQTTKSIVKLSPKGTLIARWTHAGKNPRAFDQLYGIGVDGSGNVYVSDSANRVLDRLDPSGHPTAQWSTDVAERGSFPTEFAVTKDGQVYLSDHTAHAILHLSSSGTLLGVLGKGTLSDPYGVAIGPNGNLYIGDFGGNRVVEMTTQGSVITSWIGSGQIQSPEAITVNSDGMVYVSTQGGTIVKLSSAGAVLSTWGTGTLRFNDPSGLSLAAGGRLYVTEYAANRVDLLSSNGRLLARWK